MNNDSRDAHERLAAQAAEWRVSIDNIHETETSIIGFGKRGRDRVVIKVVRHPGDEWQAGAVLSAFNGRGCARVLEHSAGAMLLEQIIPGSPLVELALMGRDEEATEILANVISQMSSVQSMPDGVPTAETWGRGFDKYLESKDQQIPRELIDKAREMYTDLSAWQKQARLLHGDLQHYNVLFDSTRGWLAVDPKGVIGETEYELGASLRNPGENVIQFFAPAVVLKRISIYESILGIDPHRALRWAFAQAVLSLVWGVEDGYRITDDSPSMILARSIRSLVD